MIHVGRQSAYPYLEEVNEGIEREFRRLLPATGSALDVGCGRGQLGQTLRGLGWRVWGVESSPEACAVAEERLDGVVRADLVDHERVRAAIAAAGVQKLDALVFSDVLEHLYDPRSVLERYLDLVAPGGRVFVSVPNAVAWDNRFRWLFGRVRYADTGIMDRTHIRFFTFETARELVQASGCVIERVASTPNLVRPVLPAVKRVLRQGPGDAPDPRALAESSAFKAYMRLVYPAERAFASLWPTMLAFRIIVVGSKRA